MEFVGLEGPCGDDPALSVLGSAGRAQPWFAVGSDCVTPGALRLLLDVFGTPSKEQIYFSHSL